MQLKTDLERWHINKKADMKELIGSMAARQVHTYDKVRVYLLLYVIDFIWMMRKLSINCTVLSLVYKLCIAFAITKNLGVFNLDLSDKVFFTHMQLHIYHLI